MAVLGQTRLSECTRVWGLRFERMAAHKITRPRALSVAVCICRAHWHSGVRENALAETRA